MAETSGLLNRRRGITPTEGSNPSVSASAPLQKRQLHFVSLTSRISDASLLSGFSGRNLVDNPYGLGLDRRLVALAEPNPRWTEAFTLEADRIRSGLSPAHVEIEHIGSTALPGLKAKPIIDIMVGAEDLGDAQPYFLPFSQLGYDYLEGKVSGDYIFSKGDEQAYLVHLVEAGGYRWQRNLSFRDRLRSDPVLSGEYQALKQQLAEVHREDRPSYTRAKMAFINAVVGPELSSQD